MAIYSWSFNALTRLHLSNLECKQLMCPNQVPYLLFGECHMEYKFQSRRADGLAYWFSRVEHSMLIVEDRPRYCSNPAGSLPWEVGPCNLLQSTKSVWVILDGMKSQYLLSSSLSPFHWEGSGRILWDERLVYVMILAY